ncbi:MULTISPECIES: glutaminyl-peptide cyclotransferase [unclassified Sphingobium]|uniref:glutaminyl-peptide cyclotransferase n=1 Tax=unclassified Sphingobium TaxID=2611147 RepID=UPI0022254A63|nr:MULTISPECIES: glutaminyl-peptide cyclotransferase [unclassified Sphingobium]MCW2413594.1 glutamine cyclotransferase [Sphingobium sp. B8D3D]MCW2414105.1 glutamine cyclotransferase [Sphingobium sp. B8D3A]
MKRVLFTLLVLVFSAGPAQAEIKWEIVRELPHDTKAFTQGLTIHGELIYETTGQVGESDVRIMRLSDGKILQRRPMRADVFGEGSTIWGDRIVSITWKDETGFVWNRKDLKPIGSFRYTGEGWGLTHDGHALIMSDGTPDLRFLDPESYKEQRRVTVTWEGKPVRFLNELEQVGDVLYANIWFSPLIARIDPASGKIDDWINLQPLVAKNMSASGEGVLNGIAWDAKAQLLYVTGKNWPKIYALRLRD